MSWSFLVPESDTPDLQIKDFIILLRGFHPLQN